MITYLQQYYPDVDPSSVKAVTVNGEVRGYYAKQNGREGDEIYLPANSGIGGNVGMFSYVPGAGGSPNDAAAIRNRIFSDNPPDYVVTIAYSPADHNNCMEVGYAMAKGANMNVTKNVTSCFSLGGYIGISQTEKFMENHPDVSSTVISCEPFPYQNSNVYDCSGEKVAAMQNDKTTVIFVTPKSFHINMQEQLKTMGAAGLEPYWLQTNYQGTGGESHVPSNRDIVNSGLIDYILGYSNEFNTEPGGTTYTPNYQLIGFDKSSGELVYADYEALAGNGIAAISLPNVDRLKASDSFEIKTTASPVQKKYESLKAGASTEIVSKNGEAVSSEYGYVSTAMNELKNQIKQSSFLSGLSNMGFRSSEGIPGCIMGYINTYFDIVGSLMNSLSLEADAVISYGQAMVDMDADLKSGATDIGTIYEIDQSTKVIAPGGLEAFDEKTQENDNKTETNTDKTYRGNDTYYGGNNSGGNGDGGSSSEGRLKQTPSPSETPTIGPKPVVTVTPTKVPTEMPTQAPPPSETPRTETDYVYIEPKETGEYYYGGDLATNGDIPVEKMPTELSTEKEVPAEIEPKKELVNPLSKGDASLRINTVSKMPASDKPMSKASGKNSSVLPIMAGLSMAAGTSLGAKAYIDRKTNKEQEDDNELEEYEYDDEEEKKKRDFSYKEKEAI